MTPGFWISYVLLIYLLQEQIFDYTFSHLGINTEGCVDHPIVLTEALSNPNPFRQGMQLYPIFRPKLSQILLASSEEIL